MTEQECKLCNGGVYKKIKEAPIAHKFYKPVKDYVMSTLGDISLADVVASFAFQVTKSFFRTIIYHNFSNEDRLQLYIEVLPKGWFFDISRKLFTNQTVNINESPRSFV